MDRRTFLEGVASLPFASAVPSLTSWGSGKEENEDNRELSAVWEGDSGQLVVLKNGDVEYEREYAERSEWSGSVRWTGRSISNCVYVSDLWHVDLMDTYLDPPFFHSVFRGQNSEVRVRQGKYSDSEYRYYVRTPEVEGEFGANEFNDMMWDLSKKLCAAERE